MFCSTTMQFVENPLHIYYLPLPSLSIESARSFICSPDMCAARLELGVVQSFVHAARSHLVHNAAASCLDTRLVKGYRYIDQLDAAAELEHQRQVQGLVRVKPIPILRPIRQSAVRRVREKASPSLPFLVSGRTPSPHRRRHVVCWVTTEQQMKKVSADVLAFAGIYVTTLQLYNHIRNRRTKWSLIMKMKSDRILDWSEDGCCFYGGDEETANEYIQLRSLIEFLHRSENNEAEYVEYRKVLLRSLWLKILLDQTPWLHGKTPIDIAPLIYESSKRKSWKIAEFLHQAVTICLNIQKQHGKLLKDFSKGLVNNKDIENLKVEVEKFATSFDMPGFTLESMKYKE
ncbi:hypothetical protein QYE76_058299 [Lolium multiflorum]|uniref:Uncharacterized protein n=1 Tax=Lolium multiflorum TaxID=4521 RepID=A0AAD8T6U6_LOLMU|nr:hypothetical protein QYE76_058299 [Lolium multiflorum]